MPNKLSDRIRNLPMSQTLSMAERARELREQGEDIISLSLGEPDFNTPDYIKLAAIEAINQNYNFYTPVSGYLELREAICEKFKRDNGLHYTPDQIVVSTGAKQSIANAVLVLLNPGDEVILPVPYWVSYEAIVKLSRADIVKVETNIENGYKITPEQLEAALTPKTRLFFLNSPNNPSGSVYSEKELRALAEVLEKFPDVIILSDEIYEHLNYSDTPVFSIAAIDSMYDRTITVNGVAKAFAMTGWRIGYIGAPQWIAKACTKMQGQITSGANCIAQRATITALREPVSRIQYMIDRYKQRRKLIIELLNEIKGFKTKEPQGAFYVFPDISYYFGKTLNGHTINNATDFSMYLLETAKVATITGDAFGAPNNIRISYAASVDDIRRGIKRIAEAVS